MDGGKRIAEFPVVMLRDKLENTKSLCSAVLKLKSRVNIVILNICPQNPNMVHS